MKRPREKLVLDDRQVALIKALMRDEKYNDQMVLSIFSHLGRTINHREIGYIRKNTLKYAHIDPASDTDCAVFLTNYRRALIDIKRSGALPQDSYFPRVLQAREAMLAAISTFNNPNMNFKAEIFITNAMIAWTYLLHASYADKGIAHQYENEKTNCGQPKYFDLSKCIRLDQCPLDGATKANLNYLLELRHEIEHRMADGIDDAISSKIQACALNFDHYIGELFGEEYRIQANLPRSIQLSEISVDQRKAMKGKSNLPNTVEAVNKAIEDKLSEEERNDPRYAYRVYLVPKASNRANNSDEAIEFVHPNSEKGEALQVTLKEVEKRKYLPSVVVKLMRGEGYRWFRQHELTLFARAVDAKNPKKGFGVELGQRWFWYEHFLPVVREHCAKRGKN